MLVCQAFPAVAQCTLRTDDNTTMQVTLSQKSMRYVFSESSCQLISNSHHQWFIFIFLEWWRMLEGLCVCGAGADCPVARWARPQWPVVCHAGCQSAPGPPHVWVHRCFCRSPSVHSHYPGWHSVGWPAGPNAACYSQQDAAGRDPQCDAGGVELMQYFGLSTVPQGRCFFFKLRTGGHKGVLGVCGKFGRNFSKCYHC